MSDKIYIVMWEELDRGDCFGGNLYATLDKNRAEDFMSRYATDTNMIWEEKYDMWIEQWKYGWKKVYIETWTMDEEI